MVEDTDASNYSVDLLYSVFKSAFNRVSRIADNGFTFCNSLWAFNSDYFAVFIQNLIDVSIEHKSSTIYSADPWKTFRNATQTENWIDERGRIFTHRIHVELNFADKLDCRSVQKAIICVEGNCVANKIHGVLLEPIFLKHISSRFFNADTRVSFWIAFLKLLHGLKEFLATSLFQKSHQVRRQSFTGSDWYFEDFHSSFWEETFFFEL